jgi:hypothetical protein
MSALADFYAARDIALGSAHGQLELDLKQVERVHAEHGDYGRVKSGERVVKKHNNGFLMRAIAFVGKKLNCEKGFGVDMGTMTIVV